ncbi:MAG: LptF/LptG family permease [Fimbriimonadaceae bacterium]|nr:LptF/LptG family permease [Fimbriimonadaceae bacterium]
MKRIDRLIVAELLPFWGFGVAIFTVLIMAGTYLYTFTRFLSQGVGPLLVGELAILFLPGLIAQTFPMAMLLATLLAFGRLSGDSEIVALRAGGVSITRIMAPVAIFAALVAVTAFGLTEFVVPQATKRAISMQEDIEKHLSGVRNRRTTQPIMENGRLAGYLLARDFNLSSGVLSDSVIVGLNDQLQPTTVLQVPRLRFTDLENWRIEGSATLYSLVDHSTVRFEDGVWPASLPKPNVTPDRLFAASLRQLEAASMSQISEQIKELREDPNPDKAQIANLEFGYWNKITLPLAALVFALVGAPLGIRSHRTNAATGFWQSVIIIFGYMMLTNALSIMSQGGAIPSWVASFSPIVIGLGAAGFLIFRKNVQ